MITSVPRIGKSLGAWKCRVLDAFPAQYEHRHVDGGEHEQQQGRRGGREIRESPSRIRAAHSAGVKTIETHGVCRPARTRVNTVGTMPRFDIPYTSREAMIRLIRAPLATASSAIAENSFSGIPSGP